MGTLPVVTSNVYPVLARICLILSSSGPLTWTADDSAGAPCTPALLFCLKKSITNTFYYLKNKNRKRVKDWSFIEYFCIPAVDRQIVCRLIKYSKNIGRYQDVTIDIEILAFL